MLSKNLNPLSRFEMLLSDLPKGCIFDGEIVVLDLCVVQIYAELSETSPTFRLVPAIRLNINEWCSIALILLSQQS